MVDGEIGSALRLRRGLLLILVSALLLGGAVVLWVAWKSLLLRPGGDDYCLAVGAQFGFLGGPLYWWDAFSGYLTPSFGANTLVGLPLLHLPFGLSSAIPFLVASLVVSAAGLLGMRLTLPLRGWGQHLLVWGSIPSLMVIWWSYWWLPMTLGVTGNNKFLAQSVTHNQTPNAGHVLQTCLVVIVYALAWRVVSRRGRAWVWVFVVGGLIGGFSGPAMSLGIVLTSILVAVDWLVEGRGPSHPVRWGVLAGVVASIAALLLAQSAPGTRIRSEQLGTQVELSPTRLAEYVNNVLPEAVFKWIEAFVSPGSLVVLGAAVVGGWLFAQQGITVRTGLMVRTAMLLATFSLMLSMTSQFGSLFAYDAFWHFLDTRVAAFLAILVAGVAGGSAVASANARQIVPGMLITLLVVVSVCVGSILAMTVSIAERGVQWESGPAPIDGVVTELLYDPRGPTCWGYLTTLRDVPSRGVTQTFEPWDPETTPLMNAR